MSSHSFCAPCARIDNSSPSVKFCMDCEETLCNECLRAHKTIKILMSHHLIDLEASLAMPVKVMSSQNHCSFHSDFILDFYCTYHDSVCCQSCISIEHRGCDKVLTLKEASKDIKASALLSNTTEGLNQILLTTEEIIKNRKSNIQKIEDGGTSIVESISKAKISLINKLDEMQKLALSKLSDKQGTVLLKMKSECNEAEQMSKLVYEHTKQMEFLSTNGSNNQIFLFLQKMKMVLADENQNIKDFIAKLQEPCLSYKETPIFAFDQDFGSIEITSQPCSVEYKETRHHEAMLLLDIRNPPRSFSLHHEIKVFTASEVQSNGITGIVFIDQNKIAVCSKECSKLYIYEVVGKRLKEVQLDTPCHPWGLAYNSTTNTIVVNLGNHKLQFIKNYIAAPAGDIPKDATHGVSWVDDKFYIGGLGKMYKLNSSMQEIQSHKIGTYTLYFIHFRDDKLYLSEYTKDNIYCIKEDGTIIFTFSSKNLKGPDGITSDGKGNIYIVGRSSNNIHRLSSDGTSSEVVLRQEDGLNEPIAICFSKDYRKLLVSNNEGRTISVFDCVY
ncbi:protein wech-like [Mytilus edulis]|uniref:protein wech-like n=1 Tax=Mytilus edulis TaxID=6550 RepID=UPI0039EE6C2E